jgi:hypothetical protein
MSIQNHNRPSINWGGKTKKQPPRLFPRLPHSIRTRFTIKISPMAASIAFVSGNDASLA